MTHHYDSSSLCHPPSSVCPSIFFSFSFDPKLIYTDDVLLLTCFLCIFCTAMLDGLILCLPASMTHHYDSSGTRHPSEPTGQRLTSIQCTALARSRRRFAGSAQYTRGCTCCGSQRVASLWTAKTTRASAWRSTAKQSRPAT